MIAYTRQHALSEHLSAAATRGRLVAEQGSVTTQIPALAGVPASKFAMAVATTRGDFMEVGDGDEAFSIQSLSKLFALCALLKHDPGVWQDVGWGPTDAGYRSLADLELNRGRPRNPFVNPGALVVTDRLMLHSGDAVSASIELMESESQYAGSVKSDPAIAASESRADHRNSAIAHVLAERGLLVHDINHVLEQYFRQCAIAASVRTLARAALFLADRSGSATGLDVSTIRRVNAVLLTSGMYGAAGDIAYQIGLPAKSGIGGGVLAIMPGQGTV